QTEAVKYDRKACFQAYQACAMRMYRRGHVERATAMIGRAIGLHPESYVVKISGRAFWEVVRWRAWAAGEQRAASGWDQNPISRPRGARAGRGGAGARG